MLQQNFAKFGSKVQKGEKLLQVTFYIIKHDLSLKNYKLRELLNPYL
jgi:hypothetical protein